MRQKAFIFIAAFAIAQAATGYAQQQETTDVRLTRIEEAIKATNQRIEDTNRRIDDTNKRIDDTNQRLDALRDDINQRLEAGFDRLANLLTAVIGLIAVVVGVVFWFARQERPIGKKHYDRLIKQDEDIVEQFNELEKEQQSQRRRLDELVGILQRLETNDGRRIEELAQKLRELEAEIAALKRPAT
jgi:peptidoglycan hydrolase CwlO-like protein